MALVTQPSPYPTRKVSAGAISGALATLSAYCLYMITGTDLPPGVEASIATLAFVVVSYMVRDNA